MKSNQLAALELSSLDIYKQLHTKHLEAFRFIPLLGVIKSKEGYKEQ